MLFSKAIVHQAKVAGQSRHACMLVASKVDSSFLENIVTSYKLDKADVADAFLPQVVQTFLGKTSASIV